MPNPRPASKKRILVVEDEAALAMAVSDRLAAEGYACDVAEDGERGLAAAKAGGFDLVLLDVMLPGKSGYDVCRDLRAAGSSVPVLMLTARSQVIDRVLGLKLGADDYLCKPFDMAELTARVEALLRRAGAPAEGPAAAAEEGGWERAAERGTEDYGDFAVDFARALVLRDGRQEALSGQEFKLLSYLTARPGQVLSRERLLEAVWSYGSEVSTRTVDVHIAWLRKKIGDREPQPRHIKTARGLGYRFDP